MCRKVSDSGFASHSPQAWPVHCTHGTWGVDLGANFPRFWGGRVLLEKETRLLWVSNTALCADRFKDPWECCHSESGPGTAHSEMTQLNVSPPSRQSG